MRLWLLFVFIVDIVLVIDVLAWYIILLSFTTLFLSKFDTKILIVFVKLGYIWWTLVSFKLVKR